MAIGRILIYAGDVAATVRFYETHFAFEAVAEPGDRIVELVNPAGGASLMIHQAARGQRRGQSAVKLVFDVEDVAGFRAGCRARGLAFGAVHEADGYAFANARDPDGNPISISSRAYRRRSG